MDVPSHRKITPRWVLALSLILILAAFLRVYHSSRESLDCDEVFTHKVATAPWGLGLELIRADIVHPPLYYWTLKATLPITGADTPGIRTVSVLAGLATIALIAACGLWFPLWRIPALIAAGLLAVNDLHIFYSQEVRSYAMFTLLIAVLLIWNWCAQRFARSPRYWLIGFALMIVLMYTHYFGAFFIFAVVIGTALSDLPSAIKWKTLRVSIATAIVFLPWMFFEYGMLKQKHGLGSNLAWQGAPELADFKTLWARYFGLPALHGGTSVALLIGFGLVAVAVAFRWRAAKQSVATLLCAAVIPPLLLFVLAVHPIALPIFADRQVLPSIVPMLLLVGAGIYELSLRSRIAGALSLIVLVCLQLIPTVSDTEHEPRRMSYRKLAAVLQDPQFRSLPLYTTWQYGLGEPLNYYLHADRVQPLPDDARSLPAAFVVLYRPGIALEQQKFTRVVNSGDSVQREELTPPTELGIDAAIVRK